MSGLGSDIGRESPDMPVIGFDGTKDIAHNRVAQRFVVVFALQCMIKGGCTTVKCLGHLLDSAPDTQVTDPDLTQGTIEVGKHDVEQLLGLRLALFTTCSQSAHGQQSMQHHHLETSIQGIRNAKVVEKNRLAGVGHNNIVKSVRFVLEPRS